jgi:hypothetical protein
MFKTHKNNIHGIKGAVKHYGKIYFHGDGNIYHQKEDSDFAKDFSNNSDDAKTYRVCFTKGDDIPDTVEELNKMLMKAKAKDIVESQQPKEATSVPTFSVDIPEDEEDALEDTEAKVPAKTDVKPPVAKVPAKTDVKPPVAKVPAKTDVKPPVAESNEGKEGSEGTEGGEK